MFADTIRCHEAKRLLESGDGVLIDVRQPAEFSQGALPNAINIPLSTIPYSVDQFKRGTHLILYCSSGHRSEQAKMILSSMGVETAHNLGSWRNYMDCHQAA